MKTQTDTDTTIRASCWSITVFNDDYDIIEHWMNNPNSFPSWLKEVWGSREACPKSGRPHQHICLVTTQIRLSTIKGELPTANISPVIKKEALKDYVMKAETSIGQKRVVKNINYITLPDMLETLGKVAVKCFEPEELMDIVEGHLGEDNKYKVNKDKGFARISNEYMKTAPLGHLSVLLNPQLLRAWKLYYKRLIARAQGQEDFDSISWREQV